MREQELGYLVNSLLWRPGNLLSFLTWKHQALLLVASHGIVMLVIIIAFTYSMLLHLFFCTCSPGIVIYYDMKFYNAVFIFNSNINLCLKYCMGIVVTKCVLFVCVICT